MLKGWGFDSGLFLSISFNSKNYLAGGEGVVAGDVGEVAGVV
jgi:hypothetical protein